MTFALILAVATIATVHPSAKTVKANDPPILIVGASPITHGAIAAFRTGSVPSAARTYSRTSTARRTVR
jgi:hypothetical protein